MLLLPSRITNRRPFLGIAAPPPRKVAMFNECLPMKLLHVRSLPLAKDRCREGNALIVMAAQNSEESMTGEKEALMESSIVELR